MVEVYVVLNEKGFIEGYGAVEYGPITSDPAKSIKIEVPENHEILEGNTAGYRVLDNKLVKDNSVILPKLRELKKQEISLACKQSILSGFSCTIQSVEYHFSYDAEAQANLVERWQLFQNDMIATIRITAKLDGVGARIEVTKEEYNSIYLASIQHKEKAISRYQDLFVPLIDEVAQLEQLTDIHWENEVVFPVEPPVDIVDTNTLDEKAKELAQIVEMNGMATIELMNIVFLGGV